MSKTKLYIWGTILLVVSNIISYCFDYDILHTSTSSLFVTWMLWLAWDYWVWKLFAGKMGVPPRISGRWKGEIISSYHHIEKNVKVVIKQTFSDIQIEMKTDQVTSCSICAHWEKSSSLFPKLFYLYTTQSLTFENKENLPQIGGGKLCFDDKNNLTIVYWTSSKTTGEIKLKRTYS